MEEWKIKECWCKHIYIDLTQIANVEIVRWGREENYCWNVYCYIFPTHSLFNKIKGYKNYYKHKELEKLPFHGGITYGEKIKSNNTNKIVSIKIGSDYQHCDDNRFKKKVTREEAWEVFNDADILLKYLTDYK
jgi:hypothetical protein